MNAKVRPKKHLGQHFLTNVGIAQRMIKLLPENEEEPVVEVGPGKGVLTQFLMERKNFLTVDVDTESVEYLKEKYKFQGKKIILGDFLRLKAEDLFDGREFYVIGNFPYHLSGDLVEYFFRNRYYVKGVVGMFQKEVSERICGHPDSKSFGVISLMIQMFYHTEYKFTVKEGSFFPPPKVQGGVVHLLRFRKDAEGLDLMLWEKLIRTAFQQRRKMLGNSLKVFFDADYIKKEKIFRMRPEQLKVTDFEWLCQQATAGTTD